MTNEPEKMNKKKTEEGAAEKPRKNTFMLFRPENSRTGSVKQGQRPGSARRKSADGKGAPQGRKPVRPKDAVQTEQAQVNAAAKEAAAREAAAKEAAAREAAAKEAAAKEAAAKEAVAKEAAAKEAAAREAAAKEAAAREAAAKEAAAREAAAKEAAAKDTAAKEAAARENSRTAQTRQGSSDNRPRRDGSDGRSADRRSNNNDRNGSRTGGGDRTSNASGRSSYNNRDRQNGSNANGSGRSGSFRGQSGQGSTNGRGNGNGSFSRNDNRSAGGRNDSRVSGGRSFSGNGAGRTGGFSRPAPAEKPFEKDGRARNERGRNDNRRTDRVEKGDKFDRLEKKGQNAHGKNQNQNKPGRFNPKPVVKEEPKDKIITIPEKLTLKELADSLKIAPAAIIKKLFLQGKMVTVNQDITFEEAEEIAMEYDVICEREVKVDVIEELLKEEEEAADLMTSRPPVVCVMGHVDHGKTSLLDAIRNTHVIDREAGGITQHIGASVVECNGQKITFLDTPGHEAFTAMRMRGANSTDIAILVVAADDGVMPQTVEAINHAKAAGIEIIVAINKIDKPGANVEKVKQELTEYELIPEDWGGSTIFVPVSAKTHEGIDTLLEMVLLTAEVLELKANPNRRARGLVIEAKLDKGRGPVATVLIQKGTLHISDPIWAGSCHGKVRAMIDAKGNPVKEAGPSVPVEILGLSDVPGAGEVVICTETAQDAKKFADTFISEGREKMLEETKQKMSLDDLFSQIQAGSLKELNLIVKADVQGSVEAVKQSLLKLSNEEVVVKVIHSAVGAINESDVILASASNAIIIGFNVRPDAQAKSTSDHEGVDVRLYRVIYDAIADVEAAMKGMLDPVFEEKVIGHGEIRQTFRASGVGTIAGSYVLDGLFQRGCKMRITREGEQIFDGEVASLKRFKDDVKEVRTGYECGVVFDKFNDVKEGDQLEAYIMQEVPR